MTEDREIDLVDLMAEVLKHWRGLLIAVLVGAVLMGGYGGWSSLKTANANRAERDSIQSQLEELENAASQAEIPAALSVQQRQNVESALYYDKLYSEAKQFAEESLLPAFDPQGYLTVRVTFQVKAADFATAAHIEQAYNAAFSNVDLGEYLQQILGEARNMTDFVSYAASGVRAQEGTNCFSIIVHYPDIEAGETIADAIRTYMEEKKDEMGDVLSAHTLNCLDTDIAPTSSLNTLNQQQSALEKIINLRNAARGLITEFNTTQMDEFKAQATSDLAEGIYPKRSEREINEEKSRNEQKQALNEALAAVGGTSVSGKRVGKHIILGAILAGFVYAGWWALCYVISGRIKDSDSIRDLVGGIPLGIITTEKEAESGPERIAAALRYRNRHGLTCEQEVLLAADTLRLCLKKQGREQASLIVLDERKLAGDIIESLTEELAAHGIQANVLWNVNTDRDAREGLIGEEPAVLVAVTQETEYADLAMAKDLLQGIRKDVLGGILIR